MTLQHKPGLDIISQLIDMHLEDIAGDILSNLSDLDIANSIAANPKWSSVATCKTQIRKLFSTNEKYAPLRAFYRREQVLAKETQEPINTSSLFLRACVKCSNLSTSHSKKEGTREHFLLTNTFGHITEASTKNPHNRITRIHITDKFIAVVGDDGSPKNKKNFYDICPHFVQLFDRWTLKLLDTFYMKCNTLNLHFIKDSANTLLITYKLSDGFHSTLYCMTMAQQKNALPDMRWVITHFTVAQLLVFVLRIEGEMSVTVYKVDSDNSNKKFDRLVKHESLGPFIKAWHIPSPDNLDYFALCLNEHPSDANKTKFQIRSKRDFKILRTVSLIECLTFEPRSFLLNDSFVFVHNEESFVDVVSPVNGSSSTVVYMFYVPKEMLRSVMEKSWTTVKVIGRFLVFYSDWRGLHAAIWKLPSDFAEKCQRHLAEDTVGVASDCDQELIDECCWYDERKFEFHYSIDQYGIVKSWADKRRPGVVHTTMLNSIISDGDD